MGADSVKHFSVLMEVWILEHSMLPVFSLTDLIIISITGHRQTNLHMHISLEPLTLTLSFDFQAALSTGADQNAPGHNWINLHPIGAKKCVTHQ